MLSFVMAGVACGFAGLCYAEFAAMLPVSGSAYSYSYATLGEFVAWFIGWNLVLEYTFAAATVAVGWSVYFTGLLESIGNATGMSLALPEAVEVCTQGIIGNIGSADGIAAIWNRARAQFAPQCLPVPSRCTTMIAAVELPESLRVAPAFAPLAAAGTNYVVEATTNLSFTSSWFPAGNLVMTNSFRLINQGRATNSTMFFRVRRP